MNLHTPERGATEKWADYVTRRKAARVARDEMTNPTPGIFHGLIRQRRATPERARRRQQVEAFGLRQFKRLHQFFRTQATTASHA